VNVFGRLAPGVSQAEAQAELTAFGQRAAADFADTHEHIRPEVLPYAETVTPMLAELSPTTLRSINLFFVMLLVLVCANVALLMFARAATRQSELMIRTALGASRGRIAGQLFGEALALGGVALVAGLSAAGFVLGWWLDVWRAEARGRLPFWYGGGLEPTTVIYAALLTLLGAAIAGVVPALKVTGRSLETRLRQSSAGGGGLKFGGIWTAVIVVQVALTVAFPAAAYFIRQTIMEARSIEAGFAAERYVAARLEMDPEFTRGGDGVIRAEFPEARFRTTLAELTRRLSAEPGVAAVTFSDQLPRTYHPLRRIEVEIGSGANLTTRIGTANIGLDFFEVLGVQMIAGRPFANPDLEPRAGTTIVNASFVRDVLGGRNATGLRMRELPAGGTPGPWLLIVGVAPDVGLVAGGPEWSAGYYRPIVPGAAQTSHLIVRVSGELSSTTGRLQALAAAIDPTLRVHDVVSLADGDPTMWMEFDYLFRLVTTVSAIALLLSLASIYAAMSFAVARRRREIGIRTALGADAVRIASATFARPFTQVGLGVLLGAGLTAALTWAIAGGVSAAALAVVCAYAILMLGICLLPAVTPLRRALNVDPTEALRADV
jgi:predicted permease